MGKRLDVEIGMVKRLKISHEHNRDRISHLPDDVIVDILSRLLLHEAVGTCFLSKHWASKWTLLTKFTYNDELFRRVGRARRFLNFLESTLPKVQILVSLELYCGRLDKYDQHRMMSCIDTAFSKGTVQQAVICCLNYDESIFLPSRVFNCSSLKVLKLSNAEIKIPTINVLPCLTMLDLMDVLFRNEDSNTDTVRMNFPEMEACELTRCSWENIKFVEIDAPKLIKFCSGTHRIEPCVDDCTTRIIGAKIEHFSVFGGFPANFHLHGTTVESARVDCNIVDYDEYTIEDSDDEQRFVDEDGDALTVCGMQLRKLLREFSGLKDLTISGDTVEAIAYSSEEVIRIYQQFPDNEEFEYIPGPLYVQLERLYVNRYVHTDGLLELLHWTPYLKFLNVKFDARADHWIKTYGTMEVPSCIVSGLEAVEFYHFSGTDNQCDLIKYVMQNGAMLQRCMVLTKYHSIPEEELNVDQMVKKEQMVEQVQSFSRASIIVQITID